jgi:hypothetical protein
MGIEPMVRVLQFLTCSPQTISRLQRAAGLSSECSGAASPCKNPEKFSKYGLPSGTSKVLLKMLTRISRPKNRR